MTTPLVSYRNVNTCKTFYANIHIAGDAKMAEMCAREYTFHKGWCVQIHDVKYVYTAGAEDGLLVRIIAYPRFPKSEVILMEEVQEFATVLANRLCQASYTIETPTNTMYYESTNGLHKK